MDAKYGGLAEVIGRALNRKVVVIFAREFSTLDEGSVGAQRCAWRGRVPSQNSSGGKTSLGRITKRGDDCLRTLLIQGAKSAVMTAHKRRDRISQWLVQLTARVGWQKAVVAMANKNARIVWAVLAKGRRFDPDHVSVKPEGCAMAGPAMAA